MTTSDAVASDAEPTEVLQPYLPRLVRYWDEENPGRLHRRVEGTMALVDISGFTRMSERLARHGHVGAEEVTEVVDDTFDRLLPAAYALGANLLKFGGDAQLLLFTGDDHHVRAAAAAFDMRAELRRIGVFPTSAGKVALRMSIGVHSGAFDFFLVGRSHRELVVAGPAATRTVQMETAASAAQILLSADTARLLAGSCVGAASGPGRLLVRRPEAEPSGFRAARSPSVDLEQFIPRGLRETLLSGEIEPEHRPATIAFLHYLGFDRLVEADPAHAASVLDDLMATVQQCADRHGVTFLATDIAADGGKMILTSGVPDTAGNNEEQMLLAVRDIRAEAPAEAPLQVGINTGYVFTGAVGPGYRRTYTIMGDAVNLAARIMAAAPAGEIYATPEVLDASRTTFEVTAPEPFAVKGKQEPVHVLSVGEPAGSRRQEQASAAPLIGRDEELAVLLDAWARAQAYHGGVVEVVADVGMGKSRLLHEMLASARPERVVATECRLYQTATPYFPFRALLRAAWGLDDPDPAATEAALADLVRSRAPDLEPWLALIGIPLGLTLPESPEVAELDDQFRAARTRSAVSALLRAAADRPTLFVIEECQWMDDASRDLLTSLTSGIESTPWLVVLSRQPGDSGFIAPEAPFVERIELRALDADHARDLLQRSTTGTPLLPSQVDLLAARAEGNPLFLLEMLHALRGGAAVDYLPQSVEGLIAARIDTLPPPDRNLLRRLAVLGAGFRREHAPAVLGPSADDAGRMTATLSRLRDFLSVDDSGWVRFQHSLIRDVAYEGLPYKLRRQLHAQVGDAIAATASGGRAGQVELLSVHYSEAGRWPEAWESSRRAGDRAKEIYANLEAATFYRRALIASRNVPGLPPIAVADVAEALGDVLELAGLFEQSVDAFRQAGRLVRDDPIRSADVLLKRARARARTGSYAPAYRDLTVGRRLVGDLDSPEALRATARLNALNAQIRQLQEHMPAAVRLAEQAMVEAEASGEREALARSYQVLDAAYVMLGQSAKAVYGERALAIYEELGDLPGTAVVTNNLGGQAYWQGRWEDAVGFYARARDAFLRAGNEAEAATCGANIGEVLVSQGRFAEAEQVLVPSVRVLRAHGLVDAAIFAEIQLARLRLLRGDDGAMQSLVALRAEAARTGQVQSAIEAGILVAHALVLAGRPQDALDTLVETERGAGGEAELYGSTIARTRALALAAVGRVDEARDTVEAGLAQAREQGLAFEVAQLRLIEAELMPDGAAARAIRDEAETVLRQLGVVGATPSTPA
ncbi:adenylate/guanylate cyclase domain-containing protein [Agromyces aurantiacus]|uniref:Adenylate/guanylate cyclase domain-containing protein n=1 Tax=Agromyces aurantiacus TaxID=165814 RepID=A0ABV9RA41_9MICO|nr:adenylate/guanylate cyclase domain-containing protein [Agromyces aurantiacus]MBM7503875.1 class 3 adenylate cyclase/tetratricopeptide (TPR) repeat protein [Agromyces aurantiacus]